MAELPYMQFFPADYLRDTRVLSLSARGAWMDIICAMWHPAKRGVLHMRLSAFGRLIGSPDERTAQIVAELEETGIGDVQWSSDRLSITITSRRIVRDFEAMEAQKQALSEAGKRGNEKRWAGHREAIATPSPPDSGGDPKASRLGIAIQNAEGRDKTLSQSREAVKLPSVDELAAQAVSSGVSREVVQAFHDACESRPLAPDGSWTDKQGQPIAKPLAALMGFWRHWQANDEQRKRNQKPNTRERETAKTGIPSTAGASLKRL